MWVRIARQKPRAYASGMIASLYLPEGMSGGAIRRGFGARFCARDLLGCGSKDR